MNENEKLNQIKDKLLTQLNNCLSVGKSRPHEYEHNHFLLIETVAKYIMLKEDQEKCLNLNAPLAEPAAEEPET